MTYLVVGVALGIVGVYVGAGLELELTDSKNEFSGFGGAIIGALIGYTLGSATGVYLVGNIGDGTGSFLATLGGSILGVLGYGVGSPIGAAIGFNLTRRYKSPPASGNALINFRDGQIGLAVPTIYSQPNSFGEITHKVDVVNMRF